MGAPAKEQRLDRLYHLDGGRDAAIIFLLDGRGQDADPTGAFVKLQIEILNKLDLPLIPLSSVSDLPNTLNALQTSLSTANPSASSAQPTPFSLLQHMASGCSPLSEHTTNLLSELGRSPHEVAALAETEQGKAQILDLLGPAEGARVLSFLAQENVILT
ncbi:hypothetical protein EsH8_I_000784 [Colletotrichum jinshuiense]